MSPTPDEAFPTPDEGSSLTPDDRSLIGRLGAHTKWANEPDRTAATAPARRAFEQGFLDQADGDPKRAASLRRAFYARLALKSAQARRSRSEGGSAA